MSQARHYEMKDSGVEWIGEIPEHWCVKPQKRVVLQRSGGAWGDDPMNDEHDCFCMRIADFDFARGRFKNTLPENLTKRNYENSQIKRLSLQHGDLLIEKSGGGEKTPVGRSVVFDKDYKALFANFMDRLRCDKEQVNPWFFGYWWRTLYFKNITVPYIKQTTGLQNLDISELLDKEQVLLPPLPEQTAIVAYLDEKCAAIDAIIAEATATIDEYKDWKASVIFEAVTKGLNPNVEMKESGVDWLNEIPRDWGVERLKTMFSFGKGLPITKEDLVEQGIPVISYGQIHAKFNTGVEVLPQLLRYVDAKWLESNANSLVSEGDFIFADTSEDMEGCGNCVYVDTLGEGAQLFAGYHTITFKPKCSKHNKFLAYLFKSDAWRTQLRSRVGGVKLFSISRRMLNLATVILPPTTEQEAIAAYLDSKCAAIDAIIAEKESLIGELEAYKKSLIFETVTGKRRVC